MKRRSATARTWYIFCGMVSLLMALVACSTALAAVSTGDGGWVWQRGLEATTGYSCVTFASSTSGWAAGDGGRILHTFDGGDTWYRQCSGTDQTLTSIDVPDGLNGWAVGAGGTILRTTDGGDSWVAQASDSTNQLDDVCAVSAQEGWVMGAGTPALLHTTDGGSTWQPSSAIDGYAPHTYMHFDADGQHGWIAGANGMNAGAVLWTTDGGQTWQQSWSNCAYAVTAIASAGDGTVIAGDGDGFVARSTDWGATWSPQSHPIYAGVNSIAFASQTTAWATLSNGGLMRTSDAGQTWRYVGSRPWPLASVAFASASDGWAVGQHGSMIRTDPTGQHWQTVAAETPEQLWSVAFTGPATGWAVGADSTSLRTTDAGATWSPASPRRPEKLEGVDAIGSSAWAVGTGGSIFATTDTGDHWTSQDSGTSDELKVVSFSDLADGWAAGTNGTILRTTDGGSTWNACESGTMADLTGVSVVDGQTAWFVGGGTATATTDGGASFWTVQLPYPWFQLIDFVDAQHGWVADGSGRLCRTTDGGLTWDDYSFGNPRVFFQAIHFSSTSDGWAFGGGCGWTTTDGGQSWTQDTQPWDSQLGQPVQAVDFDGSTGWAVGYQGRVLNTTDRGDTWQDQSVTTSEGLWAVAAQSNGTAFAVGDDGLIIHSTDGGADWAVQTMGLPRNLSALSAFDASTAYVAGQYGFSRTTDAGGTWDFVKEGFGGTVMSFPDPLDGWMAGYSGELAHTTDGGLTWQPQSLGVGDESINGIDFVDGQTGWVLGLYHHLYKTTDGGASWAPLDTAPSNLDAIDFINKDVGWVAGGMYSGISQTTDGGATWQQQAPSPTVPGSTAPAWLSALAFADAQHGWAVGEAGTILATTDGGADWVAEDSGTSQWLRGVAATGPLSAWVVGEDGAILNTTNGGFARPDDAPPVTTLDVTPEPQTVVRREAGSAPPTVSAPAATGLATGAQWFTAPPQLKLDARDASGIQVSVWAVDPPSTKAGLVPWRRGTSPVLSNQGLHLICYRSVDDIGNAERVESRWIGVDETVPVPRAPSAASTKRGHRVALKYEVVDVAGSPQQVTLLIKTTGGKLKKKVVLGRCTPNKVLSYSFLCLLKPGSYRFSVSAVDAVGHSSSKPASNRLRVR